MKNRSYRVPSIAIVTTLTVAFLFVITGFLLTFNEENTFQDIGDKGNYFETTEDITVSLYVYEYSDIIYSYDINQNTITINQTMEDSNSVYELVFTSDESVMVKDFAGSYYLYGYTEIANITLQSSEIIQVEINFIEGDQSLEPFVAVDTNDGSYTGTYMIIGGFLLGAITIFVGIILFVRSRPKTVYPQYQRTSLQDNNYQSPIEALIETDKRFCEACQIDKEKAWMRYMHPHTIMGTSKDNPFITDLVEIEGIMKSVFEMEGMHFRWKPIYAFISDDDTLGVTVGLYKRNYMKDGTEQEDKGKYMTVWKKVNGEWKAVFDMGN